MSSLYQTLADELAGAYRTHTPVGLISDRYPHLTAENGYEIQRINQRRALAAGCRITGKKIGLTARTLMESMGVEEPDYGHLYAGLELPENGSAAFDTLFEPKVEGEIAFVLGRDLPRDADARDVLDAAAYVCAAFEVPETRIAGWRNRIVDTVADNSSAGHYMLSSRRVDPRTLDLSSLSLELWKNGALLASGTAEVVLGSPLNSVAWLSNKLRSHGQALTAGQVVLSGALCGAHPAAPGDVFEARFQHLGGLTLRFV